MILYTYFDGATGPVGVAGRTNYGEDYVAAELRAQMEREAGPCDSDWLRSFQERCQRLARLCDEEAKALRADNWQRLCAETRKAVEGKL